MVATWGPAPGNTPDPAYSTANPLWHPARIECTIRNKRTDDLIATPSKWTALRWLDELDEYGTFNLSLRRSDPAYLLARKDMVIRFTIDGQPRWDGLIKRRRHTKIATRGRGVILSGVGEAARLEEGVVYPVNGLGRFPYSDEVTFDWTHPLYDDSAWDPVVVTPPEFYGYPEGFPDGLAEWIWDEDSSDPDVPAGTKEIRGHGTVPDARTYEAWSASDDTNETWANGASILTSAATAYVGKADGIEQFFSDGDVVIAARVTNLNPLKAGYLFSLLVPLDDTVSPVLHSDDTWLFRPDSVPLGMNAGQIMNLILDAADVLGEDTPTRTWTDEEDSNGDPWTIYEQLTVQVGATWGEVLRQMVDLQMCEFRKTPGSWELNLYDADGAGGTSSLTLDASNLTYLEFDDVDEPPNAMLVRWVNGYLDTEDAGLVTAEGRRTGFLALGGSRSSAAATSQADTLIASLNQDRTQVTAAYRPATRAHEPYGASGMDVGDLVPVLDEEDDATEQRCVAIGVNGATPTGLPEFEVAFNNKIVEADKRAQVVLRRFGHGNLGGTVRASTIPYQPRPIRPRGADPVIFSPVSDAVTVSVSKPHMYTRAQRIRELHVVLRQASSSGSVVVVAKRNGTTFATVTIAAGDTSGSDALTTDVVFVQRVDVLTVEVTSAGTGALGLTAQVIAA